jgi:predicted alpha/beta superfamily hydrolase
MKISHLLIFSILVPLTAFCQIPADTLNIKSSIVKNGNYIVEITLPPSYQAGKAYPICYFLDLKLAEPLMKNISDSLQRNKLVSDYIFVGIKCDDTSRWCIEQRVRDFSPTYRADQDSFINNLDTSIHLSGGAPQFLAFLKKELIPLVEARYNSIPEQRTLFGMSLSGLFASYVMIEDPALFTQYIIGAPSLWYNDFEMQKRLESTPSKKLKPLKHVYMGIGEKESLGMLEGFEHFTTKLRERKIQLTIETFPNKDHVGIWTILLVNGIKNRFPIQK